MSKVREAILDPEYKGALLSSEEHTAYSNADAFADKYYHHSSEVVSVFNLCIYLHRQSCLTEPINQNILKFLSNGLMEQWVRNLVDRKYLKEWKATEPKVLVNEQLLGAYELLAFGLLLSTIAFLIEIGSTRVSVLRNFL